MMKMSVISIALLIVVSVLTASSLTAQTTLTFQSVGDLFRQLDKDANGKVSREEAGKPRWFYAVDADKDG
jgi:Ca2+-binding EF-hand superfamily protein